MSRLQITLIILAILAAGVPTIARAAGAPRQSDEVTTALPEPPPGGIVFDLKYRGLDTPDDPLSYHSYWGWGGFEDTNDPFVRAVKSQVKECTVVYNGSLPRAKWSVVELKDKMPVAFYFDLDADGQLSAHEKFLPVASSNPAARDSYTFITSDFLIRTADNGEVPFRIMLVGDASRAENVSYTWSPCCILEGQASLGGEPMRLFLYCQGFPGSFTSFGRSSFMLVPASKKLDESLPRDTLSSLIYHDRTFYRVKLYGSHEKGKTVRVVPVKDTTATGDMVLDVVGKDSIKTHLAQATVLGAKDTSIEFDLVGVLPALPIGQYKLGSTDITYGLQSDEQWRLRFNEGPAFDIQAGQTSRIKLGAPTLSVRAINEQDRYKSDVKEQSTYAKGTAIYLSPQIKGKAGEVYMRFSQKNAGSDSMTDIKSHLTIVGPDGKQIASADLEYG